MKSWLLPVRTFFGLVLGAAVIVAAGCAAVLRGPLYGAERLARWVWRVYRGVISEGFFIKDLKNRLGILSQPVVHLLVANHPPAITTLILTAWIGVLMRGRVVIVMRSGVPFVSWVMRVTGVGVFIERGKFNEGAFQQEVIAKLQLHKNHPVAVVCLADRSRSREKELEADHERARLDHREIYEAACFPVRLHTRVPRVAGLQALLNVLPSDTTVTQMIVGHKGKPGWAIRPWDVWRPLVVQLVPVQDWFTQRDDVLRRSLYIAWAEVARSLERLATEE